MMTFCAQKTRLPLWERFHRDWLLSLMRMAVEPLPQSSRSFSGLSGLGMQKLQISSTLAIQRCFC